jgi:hypothetical protein
MEATSDVLTGGRLRVLQQPEVELDPDSGGPAGRAGWLQAWKEIQHRLAQVLFKRATREPPSLPLWSQ